MGMQIIFFCDDENKAGKKSEYHFFCRLFTKPSGFAWKEHQAVLRMFQFAAQAFY